MLFPSALRSTIRFGAPLLFVSTVLLASCEEKHIGRPCDLGLTKPMDDKVITVNPGALECPSRVCLLPAHDKTTTTGPFCTAECGSDDDCAGAETGKGMADPLCDGGFLCRTVIPRLEGNPFSCKPVCVCRDFLLKDDIDQNLPPPTCQ